MGVTERDEEGAYARLLAAQLAQHDARVGVAASSREWLLPGSWHLLSAQRSAANGARTIAQAREMEAGSSWVGVASARCPPVHPLSHTAVHATRKLQQPESTLQQPDKLAFWAYKGGKADGMPLDACSHLAH